MSLTQGIRAWLRRLNISRMCSHLKGHKEFSPLSPVLVLAPHPDDEVFGCAGLMARQAGEGRAPHVAVMTAGGGSHRGCCGATEQEIGTRRRRLTVEALTGLGVPGENVHFLDFADGSIGLRPRDQMERLRKLVGEVRPKTILVPHRDGGWPDHLAAREIGLQLAAESGAEAVEYCVWAWYYLRGRKDWGRAVVATLSPEELDLRHRAIETYLKAQAPCGQPWVGRLPEVFLKAHESLQKELFFTTTKH